MRKTEKYKTYNRKKPIVAFRVDPAQLDEINALAREEGISRNEFILARVLGGNTTGGGGNTTNGLAKNLVLLMIPAGFVSVRFGVKSSVGEVRPLVEELRKEGVI